MTISQLQEMSITLVALFNEGRYPEAEQIAVDITKIFPENAFGWKGLGAVIKSQGRAAASLEPMKNAVALAPEDAEAHINLGNILKDLGHFDEAEASYLQALEIKPDYAEAHFKRGNLFNDLGRLNEAEASYRQALAIKANFAEAFNNLGNTLKALGRIDTAETSYRQALAIKPAYAEAHINLGNILKDLDQLDQAVACYRQALEIKPDYAEAYNNLGIIFKNLSRVDEAEASYRQALEIRPDFAEAYYNLGITLNDQGRLDEAENCFRQALEINPDYAEVYSHLGVILEDLGRLDEAEASYRMALGIKPDYAEVHSNRGNILKNLGRLDEAEASYRQALEIAPSLAEVHYNLGLLLLSMGRYAEAWPCCEYRYHSNKRLKTIKIPELPYPRWKGESLIGKSLLIWPEQGFGDYIQLVRYAALLKDRGLSRITLACPLPLKALLKTVAGVDAVITEFSELATVAYHDYWSLPLSLPLYFGTLLETIPSYLPYLYAEPARIDQWRDRLPTQGFKVGLVWKGAPGHKNDCNRSLPELATLAPLWSVPGLTFISLQKGAGEDDPGLLSKVRPINNLGTGITDFADTAAIVAQLDLVICVDTAIAHLAGALGKPCWVLLPALYPDWRWLQDRSDSPWYPGVIRLFRQTVKGDWAAVITRVVAALEGWVTDTLLTTK